tara:strand:+ start:385 stop:555 length:171 start_codon:yes stop_codon:yes gene_type:complete
VTAAQDVKNVTAAQDLKNVTAAIANVAKTLGANRFRQGRGKFKCKQPTVTHGLPVL